MPSQDQAGQCPLCLGAADFYYTAHEERKDYDCASCGQFQISRKAERMLATLSENERKHFIARVSAVPDGYFVDIYCPILEPDDPADCKVQLDFVPKPLVAP